VTLDGVAAVQARIAQIQQLVISTVSATSLSGAPGAAPAPAGQSQEFASLLADAMAGGTTQTDPLSDATGGDTSGGSIGGSSMINQLIQLSQLTGAATGTTGATGLTGLAGLTGGAGATGTGAIPGSTAVNPTAQAFLNNALQEKGKPYVYGANASISDPNPKAFDCSELTKWASARAGITIPDGATAQFLYIRDHGATMSVQQALHTPGALLFHFGHEPKNLGDIPADGHVAISLGDGVHTIEARGHAYGTNVFDNAGGRSFNYAGMIPGMA
jgi:cell wall-associated NlpC family hydrolase